MDDNQFVDEKIYCSKNGLADTVFRDWTNLEQLLGYKVPLPHFRCNTTKRGKAAETICGIKPKREERSAQQSVCFFEKEQYARFLSEKKGKL